MKVTREQIGTFRKKHQPRSETEKAELLALGQNILKYGLQVPVIAYRDENGFVIVDGHRRVEAAGMVGITEIDAVILDHVPTTGEVHILQMITAAHAVGLPALDRADLLLKIKNENGWSVTELAANLNLKQPLVSKILTLAALDGELRVLLQGADQEKAYIVAKEPDPAKRLELAKQARSLTRDQVRRKARGIGELKAKTATFALPSGTSVIVRGKAMTLNEALAVLLEVVKVLRHAQKQRWDITTAQKVCNDQAEVTSC